MSVRSVQPEPKIRRVTDRLGEEKIGEIIARFEQGMPKHVLAMEYGISLSSMKNLLRDKKVKRPQRLEDRLTQQDIETLLRAFREETPQWKLARQYGIGLSSVRKLAKSDGVL